ncbi:MAG: DEAD/DEAH box helicase [Gemmobacter sp.]
MTDMNVAAPLAQALADKGYAALTPVQQAVLAEGVAGRDALVSAQTGSGKTVAFGLAIAPEVLGTQERLLYADKPLALIVAPTRELALQVAREFEWLYAVAGASLATCVGGMDYRTERRALDRGAHVVVGTPGRLRDHIERGSLDLSGLKAVVLDEADEMLDMGFREDLEFILSGAPAERRTLMFSATVPREIADMAATFQRDALRIVAQGESRQHVDIEYRALSVAPRDKEHGIFNVLRFYESRSALVFCKTRANVNHMMARMGNRGFQVVALSGELSQQERTHALQALRDGRARVCIATDVAARGIDLPGLDLVIHADLPTNSEVLLHRSGRTGRAGSKGVSCLIVTPAEFKKAQRLLQGAKVVAEWGKAPSADEVQERDDTRILAHPALASDAGDEADLAAALLDQFGAERVAAAFVRMWREGRSAPEVLSDAANVPDAAARAPRERGEFGPSVWFALNVGHEGRAEARWLLPKICDAGGIAKDGIGAIRVQQAETFVQIAEKDAGRFGAEIELAPDLTMRRLAGEPSMEGRPAARPASPRPAARHDKPTYVPKAPRVVDEAAVAPVEVAAAPAAVERPAAPERKAPAPRPEAERKPYAPRGDGAKKPYAPRAEGDRKPYAPRDDAGRKPYAPRPAAESRMSSAVAEGSVKPWRPREGEEGVAKKPRWKVGDGPAKPGAFASHGSRSHAGAGKSTGYKSHRAEDGARAPRTYAPRPAAEGGEARPPRPFAKPASSEGGAARPPRPYGKPSGDGKPARAQGFKSHKTEGGAKPAFKPRPKPAPTDPTDTSKRFVPPKKPKA